MRPFVLLSLASLTISAQLHAQSSPFYQSGNAVSIGAPNFLGSLTLVGNVPGGDAAGMALYNAGGGGGASVSLDLYNTWANAGIPQAKIKAVDDGAYSDHLTFWTKVPGQATNPVSEKMRITSTGNVGIGTTNPRQTLEVNGNVLVDGSMTVAGSLLAPGTVGPVLQAPSNGSYNFAVGIAALPSSSTGTQNTAAGYGALGANTSGSSNTAVGTSALSGNTTGYGNTAVGGQALPSNATGVGNTVIGTNALRYNQAGSYNVAIGYGSGGLLINGSQNIYLGQVAAGQSDTGVIRIGDASSQTATFIAGIRGVSTWTPNAIPVLIDSNGQLGTLSSSRRFKEDIQDMGDASAALMRLRPVTFRYRKPFEDGSKPIQYGLIAEEVAEVYPDLVAHSADGQVETVKYQMLDPLLLNEVQRLHGQNIAQQDKIRDLENRLSRLEAMLDKAAVVQTQK